MGIIRQKVERQSKRKGHMDMKKNKKAVYLFLMLFFSISLGGCGMGDSTHSDPAEGTELNVVRIGRPSAGTAAFIENAGLAEALGYIDEELEKVGYRAEYTNFGQGGTAINEALSSSQLDMAFLGDIPPLIAKSSGLNVEVIASLNSESEIGIVVGQDTEIKSVKDLKGKRIAAGFGTITYVYLVKLLQANNMKIDDVEMINDVANGGTLVASGDADAVVSSATGIYRFQETGIGRILTTSREDTSLSSQYFLYGDKDFIDSHGDVGKAIIRALLRSKDYATQNPEGAYKALETDTYSAQLFSQIYPREDGFDKFAPYLTKAAEKKFNEMSKILCENEIIPREVTAEELFNNQYNDDVYGESGLAIPE